MQVVSRNLTYKLIIIYQMRPAACHILTVNLRIYDHSCVIISNFQLTLADLSEVVSSYYQPDSHL